MQNPAFQNSQDEYYVQEKSFMWHLFPEGLKKVMDLGCASGGVGSYLLRTGKASEMHGAEIFEKVATEARKKYKAVHVGDLEEMKLVYDREFDMVVCGDVLEHLRDPAKVVEQARGWLKDGGLIVCCVPNVRYWRVCRDLALKGKWEYASEGVMDQTHLRFFTSSSLRKMLEDCGFKVERAEMHIADGPKQRALNRLTFGLFQGFLGVQILMTARKT